MKKTPITSRSKQPYVIEKVTKMAIDSGPGAKLPTAQKLAKQLGVTLTTLDRSLGKLESKGIINRRQGSGIYVSNTLLSQRVGLVFGRNIFQFGSSAFYLLLLQHCEQRAAKENQLFSFYLTPPHHDTDSSVEFFNPELANALKQGRIDGLLMCEVRDQEQENWIHAQKIPTITLAPGGPFPSVGIDSNFLINASAKALAAKGCKTIGLLGIVSQNRIAFEKAAKKHKLKIHPNCVIHPQDDQEPPFDRHEPMGYEWMKQAVQQCGGITKLPDGIIISDDILARGACLYMKDAGIRIGVDLQVVSHANKGSLVLEYWQDSLILAEIDPKDVVDTMFKQLELLMSNAPLKKDIIKVKPKMRNA
jgi:DNA-binding LacI/PurR family transcriptional regulator